MRLFDRLFGLRRKGAEGGIVTHEQTDEERASARKYWQAQVTAERERRGVPANRRG